MFIGLSGNLCLGLPWVDLDGDYCRTMRDSMIVDELTVRLIEEDGSTV